MPQKLKVKDYTFYFVPDEKGKYEFGQKNPQRGHIGRKARKDWKASEPLAVNFPSEPIFVFAIASVKDIATGEHFLVYELFNDLKDEQVPAPRQHIYMQHLLDEIRSLKLRNKRLRELLKEKNILILDMSKESEK
jgi:hypothetical protein